MVSIEDGREGVGCGSQKSIKETVQTQTAMLHLW